MPLLIAGAISSASAQDVGRVSPASLPMPLPTTAPMPPDQLRAHNPWNLPMTGKWRFQLAYGQITADRQFQPSLPILPTVSASTSQAENPPSFAFDGNEDTRWCASGGDFPQWLQADLGQTRHVTGAVLTWEFTTDTFECRIEGRNTPKLPWQTLKDATAAPGIGDGPVMLTPADVRYVRIEITGCSDAHWASLREMQIQFTQNGQQAVWHMPVPKPVDPNLPASLRDAFVSPSYNDSGWHVQNVPFNWEVAGYSLPTYDRVDKTVGLYRRIVTIPAAWAGRRIYWHFDGAFDGTEVFVNGTKAGYHESGYTAWDIDLTGLVHLGQQNLFALRVSKTVPSFDADTGDFQSLGGIYRDTSLIAVPQTHVSDITVRTPLSENYKDATLNTQVDVAGTPGEPVSLTARLFSGAGKATSITLAAAGQIGVGGTTTLTLSKLVTAPALWSAEKPNLYYVVFALSSNGKATELVEQRFGFRQIDIKNNVVLWNGMPIKCTGICRHDFWADKGFALTEKEWSTDIALMKAANINAIRTSHYNHAQRLLELCDEKGMYILDEVPYCWINDQVKDPTYAPYLLQRAQETLARDKNRPCVLAWSLGNENPNGIDSQKVMDLVKQTDPTRPAFVSGQSPDGIKGQDWEDNHYPSPDSIDRFGADPKWGANITEHPHTFYEKEVQDYDPGMSDLWSEALIRTWDKLWKDPTILGSFIWEWQNQGIADKNDDSTTDFWYGPGHMRQENNKGIVTAYRVPKPEWWIVKSVYSPVVVTARTIRPADGVVQVPVTNHYSFTNLSEVTCRWTALRGTEKLQTGVHTIACGPMESVTTSFPAPAGMTTLRLEFFHGDGTSIIAFNLAVDGSPIPTAPSALASGGALTAQDGVDALTVSNSLQRLAFDKISGTIRSWRVNGHDVLVGGPILNLGEAKNKGGDDRALYRSDQPPVTTDAKVSATPGERGAMQVAVTSTVLTAPGGSTLGTLVTTYDVTPGAQITVNWTLNWTAADVNLWEEGVKFVAPAKMTRMAWLRDSFFTDYPAGHLGEPSGTAQAGDVLFRSSKRSLHWLTLSNGSGEGIALMSAAGVPLLGRANTTPAGIILFASREAAGDYGLSRAWVADHAIRAAQGKSLSGAFTLRAFNALDQTAAIPRTQ
jgi:beta-galactosidase